MACSSVGPDGDILQVRFIDVLRSQMQTVTQKYYKKTLKLASLIQPNFNYFVTVFYNLGFKLSLDFIA